MSQFMVPISGSSVETAWSTAVMQRSPRARITLLLLWLSCIQGLAVSADKVANKDSIVSQRSFLFPCGTEGPSNPAAASVHALTPADIRVFGAIGSAGLDSSTGVSRNLRESIESSITSAKDRLTAGIVDRLRNAFPQHLTPMDNLPSDKAQGDLLEEAQSMVDKLKQSQNAKIFSDWKLIVIFLHAKDPCNFCKQQDANTLEHMVQVAEVLDYLQRELPKALVNLVDFTDLIATALSHPSNGELGYSCDCFRDSSKMNGALLKWSFQEKLETLLGSGRYDEREDFTVVLQPFGTVLDTGAPAKDGFGGLQCSAQDHQYLLTYRNSKHKFPSVHHKREVRTVLAQERKIGTNISCNDTGPSANIPVSVHSLRPADIKVVAAMGDSLTAGNGAGAAPNDLLGVATQYRGISWSIGGDGNLSTVTTLPNILRNFNPLLQGFSTGRGGVNTASAFFNQAKPGAKSDDMKTQAEQLVKRMKNDSRINFQEDWKLLTLFIGGNDLCDICDDLNYYSPEQFAKNIKEALDVFHAEVPRMFVNLVTVLHILPLRELYQDDRVSCPRWLVRILCDCVVNPANNSTEVETLARYNREYQVKTRQLVDSGRYDTTDDFTVVVQPFLEHLTIPKDQFITLGRMKGRVDPAHPHQVTHRYQKRALNSLCYVNGIERNGLPDKSYLAPDCFHFGEKAHAQGARALWNNMLEPLGSKTDNQDLDTELELKCPSQAQPFLRTFKNSGYIYPTYPTAHTTTTVAQEVDQVYGSQLLCTDRAPSSTTPTSVHALRPADVKVVAAVGDSLTAGNGVGAKPNNLLDVLTEYRGLSWSVGGDLTLKRVTTLPNILREFNPLLTGFSTGKGKASAPNAFLNQAVAGAKAEHLTNQVRKLISLMKNDTRINFENDWKVITILVGPNDLCAHCTDTSYYSAQRFVGRIREALDVLHQEVPKAFVNLAEVMYMMPLRQALSDDRVKCPTVIVRALCHCVLGVKDNSEEFRKISDANRAYQISTQQLIDTGRYDTREDFTVVLQPFFRNAEVPLIQDGIPDVTFLAPDCFHMSQKAHSQFSRSLWNNMLQPLGQKSYVLDFQANITLGCPSQAAPFLRTYKNSDYSYSGPPPTEKPIENWGSDLMCAGSGQSPTVPTSVHHLRPADIKVIGALGDSLTTGFGANSTNLGNLQTDWRGLSWSSGGDGTLEKHTTLPNILKKFNPELYGFSTGTEKKDSRFNAAVGGAKAGNMPTQARDLVGRMNSSSEMQAAARPRSEEELVPDFTQVHRESDPGKTINFKDDWKIITLFIGGNDLCQYCLDRETLSEERYIEHLQETLDILYREVPRVFVNMVQILEVEGLRQISQPTLGCSILKPNACPCFIKPREDSPELSEMKRVNRHFQEETSALVHSGRYDGREDFAVVLQPFFQNPIIPRDSSGAPDLSFFSVDCFHFSERGHAEMAIALWNNMLEPVGHKQDFNNHTHSRSKLKCPTPEKPYLYTIKNSRLPAPDSGTDNPANKDDMVPFWVPIVAAIGGLLAGSLVVFAWAAISRKKRGRKKKSVDREHPATKL